MSWTSCSASVVRARRTHSSRSSIQVSSGSGSTIGGGVGRLIIVVSVVEVGFDATGGGGYPHQDSHHQHGADDHSYSTAWSRMRPSRNWSSQRSSAWTRRYPSFRGWRMTSPL